MKLSLVITTPEVRGVSPVALLSGSFAVKLEAAVQLGYDGVELMPLRPADLDGEELAAQLSYCGLELAAVSSGAMAGLGGLTLLAADLERGRAAETRLHELIAFAAAAHAPLVTIGGFRGRLASTSWTDRAGARRHLVEVLRRAAERAAAASVRLALEPLNRYETDIVNTAAEGLALIAEVGHPNLGLLLDTFHMNIEEADYDATIQAVAAAGRLFHVHIGDSNRLPPGSGHIDFQSILDALSAVGYRGYLSAELLGGADPEAAARATIQALRTMRRAAMRRLL